MGFLKLTNSLSSPAQQDQLKNNALIGISSKKFRKHAEKYRCRLAKKDILDPSYYVIQRDDL